MKSRVEIKRQARQAVAAQRGAVIVNVLLLMLVTGCSSLVPFGGYILPPILTVGSAFVFLQVYVGQKTEAKSIFSGFRQFGRNLGTMLLVRLITTVPAILTYIISISMYVVFMFSLGNMTRTFAYMSPEEIFLWFTSTMGVLFVVFVVLIAITLAWSIVVPLFFFPAPYILSDSPSLRSMSAFRLAVKMMKGRKASLFAFQWSFIGWILLGILPIFLFFASIPAMVASPAVGAALMVLLTFLGYFAVMVYMICFLSPYMDTSLAGFYLEMKEDALQKGDVVAQDFQ